MSMRQCLVVNCGKQFGNAEDNVTFHRFPWDADERKKWLRKCGREETLDCSRYHVCSRHFSEEDFVWGAQGKQVGQPLKKVLKSDVVPHLNLFKIKQEPLDADEFEVQNHITFSLTEFHNAEPASVICKSDVENSLFESRSVEESHPHTEAVPVEPLVANPEIPTVQNSVSSSSAAYIPSSLPASQNWNGQYDFDVSFGPQEKNTKGVSWTYSKLKDKLYVGKDAPCPINFSVNGILAEGVIIRATALYSSPEHTSEVVHRCVNHSMSELQRGIFEAEHLVRCESKMASYEVDQSTKRHSVIVPFDNPPVGQEYSTYIFKFTCFGSCAGGPNRRPLMLIFSLENGGKVLGRRKLDVKICACPGRDRRSEEQQVTGEEIQPSVSLKRKEKEMVSLADTLEFTRNIHVPPSKKLKSNASGPPYLLSVSDRECYDFLVTMKNFFDMCKTVHSIPPSVKKLIIQNSLHKNSEQDTDSP